MGTVKSTMKSEMDDLKRHGDETTKQIQVHIGALQKDMETMMDSKVNAVAQRIDTFEQKLEELDKKFMNKLREAEEARANRPSSPQGETSFSSAAWGRPTAVPAGDHRGVPGSPTKYSKMSAARGSSVPPSGSRSSGTNSGDLFLTKNRV